MKKITCTLHIISAVLFATAAAATSAAPNLEPGEWKITVQTDMSNTNIPGLPGLKIPAQPTMTHNWCYKPEPGKDLGETIADNANRNQVGAKCEMLENKSNGNNVRYKMRCVSENTGTATITGDFILDGKKYNGKTVVDLQSPMGPMQATSTLTGDYLGPCKAPATK